jgi:hypothetical protein
MESLDIIPGISQMPHGTSRPGSSHLRLGSGRPQSNKCIASLPPDVEPDSSPIMKAKPIQPVSLYSCIFPLANHHIDIGFGRKHGDGTCVARRIDGQSAIFDVISSREAIRKPILLRVSFYLISVTKL